MTTQIVLRPITSIQSSAVVTLETKNSAAAAVSAIGFSARKCAAHIVNLTKVAPQSQLIEYFESRCGDYLVGDIILVAYRILGLEEIESQWQTDLSISELDKIEQLFNEKNIEEEEDSYIESNSEAWVLKELIAEISEMLEHKHPLELKISVL